MRTPELHEIEGAFADLLRGPSGDGANKRARGEKPHWKVDTHKDAMYRHLARWEKGQAYDADSGCHHLVHMAWRALAIAYQEMSAELPFDSPLPVEPDV